MKREKIKIAPIAGWFNLLAVNHHFEVSGLFLQVNATAGGGLGKKNRWSWKIKDISTFFLRGLLMGHVSETWILLVS